MPEPCVSCGEPGRIVGLDAEHGEYSWLCEDHAREESDRYSEMVDTMSFIQMRVDKIPVLTAAMKKNQTASVEWQGKGIELFRVGDDSEAFDEWMYGNRSRFDSRGEADE